MLQSSSNQPSWAGPVLHIKGLQGISLLDYPGHVSTIVFFGGCNFQCPYCQNPGLVKGYDEIPDIDQQDAFAFIEKRRHFIDAVVLSGGEPTLQASLPHFARSIKDLGLMVKLDTNGYHPGNLKKFIDEGAVDYIAMDFKTSLSRYPEAAGKLVDIAKIDQSIELLLTSGVDFEFRTTAVPGLVEQDDILSIAKRIKGAPHFALQQFHKMNLLDESYMEREPHSPDTLRQWMELARPFVDEVIIRGI